MDEVERLTVIQVHLTPLDDGPNATIYLRATSLFLLNPTTKVSNAYPYLIFLVNPTEAGRGFPNPWMCKHGFIP